MPPGRRRRGADASPPTCGIQIADVVAASFAALAIQSALLARAATGRGQHIDLALAEGMLALMPLELVQAQFPADTRRARYRPIRTCDSHVVVTPISQRNFLDLCTAMGRTELQTDPRFATPIARSDHWDALLAEVGAWAITRRTAACVAELEAHGVPAAAYRGVAEAIEDPQLRGRGFLASACDDAGEFAIAGLPFQLDGAPVRAGPARVPRLGEHSAQVLSELLALEGSRLDAALRSAGAV